MTKIEYLLQCLSEECAEVQQRISKALRFGLNEKQIDQDLTNLDRINYELSDVATLIRMLEEYGIEINMIPTISKANKVDKYMQYSIKLGIVEE